MEIWVSLYVKNQDHNILRIIILIALVRKVKVFWPLLASDHAQRKYLKFLNQKIGKVLAKFDISRLF